MSMKFSLHLIFEKKITFGLWEQSMILESVGRY